MGVQPGFRSKLGFGKCPFVQDGGRQLQLLRARWFNVKLLRRFSYSTALEPCLSSRRYDCLRSIARLLSHLGTSLISCDKQQYWRLLTTFIYFGPLSLDLVFHVFFLTRYSRLLEESSGRSAAQFSWLLLYAMTCLICINPLVSMPFLGHPLSSTLVYIWSRRNPDTQLSFLGLLVFTAPYLPWVLMGFSLVLHGTVPKDELMGVVIGHVWYFFCDVYPPLHNGHRPFDPPMFWRRLFERQPREETADAINNDIAMAAAPGPEVR